MANTKITNPELFNLGDSTSATQLPVFTTSTRPTPTTSTVQVEYLVIGGGGAGGGWGGGGGAGGYLTNYGGSKTPLTSGLDYAIAVGEGGIKQTVTATAANSGEDSSIIGTAISITATGGGAGGTYDGATGEFPAQDGGSGGGGSSMRSASSGGLGATGQGNDGGDSPAQDPNYPGGGGGGGASSVGGDGQSASGSPAYAAGNGGDGLASSITGTSITRAGGGGGFTYGITVTNVSSGGTGGGGAGGRFVSSGNGYNTSPSNAVDGQVNTGSGGGSGSVVQSGSGSQWYGGNTASGGSGIVILRYPTNSSPVIKTTGSLVYTQSTDGSDTVIQFTEGSGNVSFASAGITVGEMIFNSTTGKVEYWDGFQWNMIEDQGLPPAISSFTVNPTTLNEGDTFSLIQASLQATSGIASYVVNAQISGQADAIVFEDTAVAGNPTSLTVSNTTTVAAWNWDSMSVTVTDTNGSSATSSLVTLSITSAPAYTVELEYRSTNSNVTWVGCTPWVTGNFRSWSYSDYSYKRKIVVTAVAGSTVGVYTGWNGSGFYSISEYAPWPGWSNLRNIYGASTAPPPWVSPSYTCRTGYCTWTNNFPAQNVSPSNTGICGVQGT
jgi:hypothetical protein